MKEKIFVEIRLKDNLKKEELINTVKAIGMIRGVFWTTRGPAKGMTEEDKKTGAVYEVV
ncbi:hypothetical protein KAR91_21540 [Candidatus Pacearchaeota archaeon]|nr:hypothetical protein [Candidatus Pacearchaeota archaeon]